jgi:hypothetical protein
MTKKCVAGLGEVITAFSLQYSHNLAQIRHSTALSARSNALRAALEPEQPTFWRTSGQTLACLL